MTTRATLAQLGLGTGKKARLHRILHQHGLRNGTAIFLPYDQGLEHGPRDFFANPPPATPATSSSSRSRAASTASPPRSDSPRSSTGTTPARCR